MPVSTISFHSLLYPIFITNCLKLAGTKIIHKNFLLHQISLSYGRIITSGEILNQWQPEVNTVAAPTYIYEEILAHCNVDG